MKILLPIFLLIAFASQGQVSYRNTYELKDAKKRYDSTFNFDKVDCTIDPASMVGQEIFFLQRSPSFKANYHMGLDSTSEEFTTDKEIPVKELRYGNTGNRPMRYEKDQKTTNLYMPVVLADIGRLQLLIRTPYSALENRSFKVIECTNNGKDFSCDPVYTLLDNNNERITWKPSRIGFEKRDYIAVKGYLEHLRKTCVNKKFYVKEKGGKTYTNMLNETRISLEPLQEFLCTDISYVNTGENFPALVLIFKDKNNSELGVYVNGSPGSGYDDVTLTLFMTDEQYTAMKADEQRKKDEQAAREKAAQEQEKQDAVLEQKQRAIDHARLIKTYGAATTALIENGQVKLGMGKKACMESWGEPSNVKRLVESGHTVEVWMYSLTRWLHFSNGVLTKFME